MEKIIDNLNRRRFIKDVGISAAGLLISPRDLFSQKIHTDKKIRIGIIGGRFGASFNFHEHPNCIVEGVSDLRRDRRDHLMEVYKCSKSYDSLERLLKDSKIEAVFIATPAPDHVRHVKEPDKHGKKPINLPPKDIADLLHIR